MKVELRVEVSKHENGFVLELLGQDEVTTYVFEKPAKLMKALKELFNPKEDK